MDYLRSHWTLEMYVAPITYAPSTWSVMTLQIDLVAGLKNLPEHKHFFMKWWEISYRAVKALNRLDIDCHIQPWPDPNINPHGLIFDPQKDDERCKWGERLTCVDHNSLPTWWPRI